MAKRDPSMTLPSNQQGQISIFFSASLVVMITIVAFVINVGLFVKAKINLQNATDAAAYAGAAVQSRQLSKIAYLNWEMRNIYKEWMYKYYVIGNLNIRDVEDPSGTGVMQFKLANDVNVLTGDETTDPYNIPAVCIHIAGSQTNICKRYSIPGLPEFGSSNLPGAEEASRNFLDSLIATKVNDCVDRTRLNMLVANTWTYNILASSSEDSLAGRGPAILTDRQGAWPKAIELAMRIRNLEFVMNRPAVAERVCVSGASEGCSRSVTQLEQENKLGNERIVKAFYSGYRNIGGAGSDEVPDEMKSTFSLTEIPPTPVDYANNDSDASSLLIPNTTRADSNPRVKQWVDLKLMMVNYAIFYAALIPRADTRTSGACDVSKVAIPVPGYPMGFYKNPDVLTYYAVRGEAEFIGMFNPFRNGPVKMTAYSAAKPFGGRIGPMLFTQKQGQSYLTGRSTPKFRSIPYITSYDFQGTRIRGEEYSETREGAGFAKFIPGLPLPTNAANEAPGPFWLDAPDSPLGGRIANANEIQFGVPNLVYDYQVPFQTTGYSLADEEIFRIRSADPSSEREVGLFSKFQFNLFKGTNLSATISPEALDHEIARVRAPTSYEAANYLIPTPYEFNLGAGLDSFGFINSVEGPQPAGDYQRYNAQIYAPLFKSDDNDQVDIMFSNANEVRASILDFMAQQLGAMEKYRKAMNRAALNIFNRRNEVTGGALGSRSGYKTAALGVSDIQAIADANPDTRDSLTNADYLEQNPTSCSSIAGQFLYYYLSGVPGARGFPENNAGCPVPLSELFQEFFSGDTTDAGADFDPTYYAFRFSWDPEADNERFLTAYVPGPFTGVQQDGTLVNEIPGGPGDKMRRNTYSTKFVTLDSLQIGRLDSFENPGFCVHSEGDTECTEDTRPNRFANPLAPADVGADLTSIKY